MNEKLENIRLLDPGCRRCPDRRRIVYDANGLETKFFNVKDGHGIKMLQRYGVEIDNHGTNIAVVDFRARELGIELVYQGALRKLESYDDIKKRTGLSDSQIAYMGDDIIDVPVLRRVGFFRSTGGCAPGSNVSG